jgi:hypothetical protein
MPIKIEGLDKLLKDLDKFGKDGEMSAKKNIEFSATNIEVGAVRDAPAQLGGMMLNIKQRIDKTFENGGLTAKVGIQGTQDLDFYLEAGTGLSFQELVSGNKDYQTPEFIALARTFYKTGDGTLRPRPYLFPNFFRERPILIEKLKKDLDNLAKKV